MKIIDIDFAYRKSEPDVEMWKGTYDQKEYQKHIAWFGNSDLRKKSLEKLCQWIDQIVSCEE